VRFALVLLVLLGACERDYDDSLFRCDALRGCPEGQGCVGGRCRRGGVAGAVACGPGGTCTGEQQCCIDNANPPRCIPAGDECAGISAICDGTADCQPGDSCCDGVIAACQSSCQGASVVCTTNTDCPSAEPNCCVTPDYPWGFCQFRTCEP